MTITKINQNFWKGDRPTDRQTNRPTESQPDRQTNRQADRLPHQQTDRPASLTDQQTAATRAWRKQPTERQTNRWADGRPADRQAEEKTAD